MKRDAALKKLAKEIKACRGCTARDEATCPVPGIGDPYSEIVFVGRNPGQKEDAANTPFVGPSGVELNKQLVDLELSREDVFIANLLLCHTEGDRPPVSSEIKACFKFLRRYLEIIQPKLVVTYGAQPAKYLASVQAITKSHGRLFKHKAGFYIVTCIHPGAMLHNNFYRAKFAEDTECIRRAMEILKIGRYKGE